MNVTQRLRNQLRLIFLPHLIHTSALPGKTWKHFSLKCHTTALPEFNQSLLDFFNILNCK